LAKKLVAGVATDFDNRDRTENIAVESISDDVSDKEAK
jgi:hypothetical protein